jgi:hypothetical protein
MPLPPEVCEECGKKINRRAIANVFECRVTCTACWRGLTREKEDRESEARENSTPATERQVQYARDLGLTSPAGINKRDMSRLISVRLLAKYHAEADSIGLAYSLDEDERSLRSRIWRRKTVYAWTISVCRHLLKAKWLFYREAGPLSAEIMPVVLRIEAGEKLVDRIAEQDEGYTDDFLDDLDDRGHEGDTDTWYLFGTEGPSPRSKAYLQTKEMLQRLAARGA